MEQHMNTSNTPALRRIVKILRRRNASGWGANYQPAIRSSRSEAPSISRASEINSREQGRSLQMLSPGEQEASLLALHQPALFDLHEQRELSAEPAAHPLQSHPLVSGRDLPGISGTLAIAERLGALRFHPRTWVASDEQDVTTGEGFWAPGFWIGDLLLFLADEQGPYCVHWDVKAKHGDHGKPGPGVRDRSGHAAARARARHEVMCAYYQEAGIRSVSVARDAIDRHASNNLRALFGWHQKPPSMTLSLQRELLDRLRVALSDGTPPIEIFSAMMKKASVSFDACKRVFYRAIWRRELRVDLFHPVLVDRPMRIEMRDVLIEYASWFAR
jgi:hypothetical protein